MENVNDDSSEMFMNILELSDDDKRALYKKCKKDELIEMLICNNNVVNALLEDMAQKQNKNEVVVNVPLISPPNFENN